MFILTADSKRFAMVVSVLFFLTIGSYFYSFRVGDLPCGRNSISTQPFCFAAAAGGFCFVTGLVIGTTWRFMPISLRPFLECSLSLVGTIPSGFTAHVFVKALAYAEIIQSLSHIRELTIIPLTAVDCLKNETIYSAQLIRNSSVFQHHHMNQVNTGVVDIAAKFNNVNGTQHQFRDAVEMGFKWLESKGFGCQQVISKPFETCLNATKASKKDCQVKGADAFCDIVNISEEICLRLVTLSRGPCQDLGPKKITEMLMSFRERLSSLASGAIRMRVGILFELHATSNVGNKLNETWTSILTILRNTSEFIRMIYDVTIDYVLKLMAAAGLLFWPIGYVCFYLWGPLSFDNFYMTHSEHNEIQGLEEMTEIQMEDLQVVPVWLPTPKEIVKMLWHLIFAIDQLVIIAVLLVDFYYTNWVNDLHAKWTGLFQNFQKNLFGNNIQQTSQTAGIGFIGDTIVQQLEKLQEAIGFCRLLSCIRPAPPIPYSYNVFFIALAQRALYIFAQTKWRYLPSFICARFYHRRHDFRMSYLKAKIIFESVTDQDQSSRTNSFASRFKRMFSNCILRLRDSIHKKTDV
jgi:hypothetical protein